MIRKNMKYFPLVIAALTLAAPAFAQRSYKGARPESRSVEGAREGFLKGADFRQQREVSARLKKELAPKKDLRLGDTGRLLKGQLLKMNRSNHQRPQRSRRMASTSSWGRGYQRPQRSYQRHQRSYQRHQRSYQRPQFRMRCPRMVTPTFARNGYGWNWNRSQGKHWVRR
tara:strand:+ start:1761 stop:2270 length:510 start_codon:yes stop_codon:yes gene_type:complete